MRRDGVSKSGGSTGDRLRSGVGGSVRDGGVVSAGLRGTSTLKSTTARLSNDSVVCVAMSILMDQLKCCNMRSMREQNFYARLLFEILIIS